MTSTKPTLLSILLAVRDSRAVKGCNRVVLTDLALRASEDKGKWICWPSYRRLAIDSGMPRSSVIRTATNLAKMGLIKIQERPHRSNVFMICVDKLEELAAANKKPSKGDVDDTNEIETSPYTNIESEY